MKKSSKELVTDVLTVKNKVVAVVHVRWWIASVPLDTLRLDT